MSASNRAGRTTNSQSDADNLRVTGLSRQNTREFNPITASIRVNSTASEGSNYSRAISADGVSGGGPIARSDNTGQGGQTALDHTNRLFKVSMSYLSIGIEPLFALFLAMAIQQAIPILLALAHVSEEAGEDAGWFLAVALGICNLASDVLFFNAVTEALEPASASIVKKLQPLIDDHTITQGTASGIKYAASAFRWLALIACWPVGAGADGVALSAFTSDPYVAIPLALVITGLGMYYYHMGYGSSIDEHTIGAVLHRQEGLAQMRAHRNKAIELVTKAGINNLSRGITFGYILYALATNILHTGENNITLAFFVAATIVVNTFMSAMTRTLPCYRQIFGIPLDQYDNLSLDNDIKRIRSQPEFAHNGYAPLTVSKVVDMAMSFIRAIPVAYLILRGSHHPVMIAAATVVGAVLFAQSYSARINIRADNAAYKILKGDAPAAAPLAELADLGGANAMAEFNSRVEIAKKNPFLKGFALLASTGGRLARLIASYWFVAELFGLFAEHGWVPEFSDLDFLMLDLLIFTPPAEADAPLFNNANWKTLAEHIVRAHYARKASTTLGAISAFFGCTNEELVALRSGGLREHFLDGQTSERSSVLSDVVGTGYGGEVNPIFDQTTRGPEYYSPPPASAVTDGDYQGRYSNSV